MTKQLKQHKLLFPILSILWVIVILSFSLQDGSRSSLQSGMITTTIQSLLSNIGIDIERQLLSFLIRKAAHFTEFFILGVLVKQSTFDLKNTIPLYLACLVPVIDETVQSFIPGRAMAITDMFIDLSGILFGFLIMNLIHNIHKKRKERMLS